MKPRSSRATTLALALALWSVAIDYISATAQESNTLTKRSETRTAESGFNPLLAKDNLDGWIPRGGTSQFRLQKGMLVGTCVEGSPSTYLCTKSVYKDFVLELEFFADSSMNSGVQVRTQVAEKDTEYLKPNGKKRTLRKGAVYGYQVEIDPTNRRWSGGIYDQSRRGWLQSLEANPKAQQAYQMETWNHLRIRCQGNRIQTWLNEVPAADMRDEVDSQGVIGLQIHGAGRHKDRIGAQAKFRNIRLKKLK
ncbi:MAG: DUF1080 domain-containing protein [Verrucomicrobia bacterium]|nr:DUF1080 domain-containing protein [Verrucomicrobiota bacterium]